MIHSPSRPAATMKLSWTWPSGLKSPSAARLCEGSGTSSAGNAPCVSGIGAPGGASCNGSFSPIEPPPKSNRGSAGRVPRSVNSGSTSSREGSPARSTGIALAPKRPCSNCCENSE